MERMKMKRENENENRNPRVTFSTIGSTFGKKNFQPQISTLNLTNHRNSSHVVSVLTWNTVQYLLCVGTVFNLLPSPIKSDPSPSEKVLTSLIHTVLVTHTLTHLHPWSSDVTGLMRSLLGVCLMRQTPGFWGLVG